MVRQALNAMKDGLRDMENLMANLKVDQTRLIKAEENKPKSKKIDIPATNPFSSFLGNFFAESKSTYDVIVARFKQAEVDYDFVVSLYGEDSKVMFPDEFFGIFWSFTTGFVNARKENEEAITKEKDAVKRETEKKVPSHI
jgi:hypothetical protein